MSRRSTPGQSKPTALSLVPAPQPNPLKVAHMIGDSVEMAAKVVIPLEVRTGARSLDSSSRGDGGAALLNVLNTEDGIEYLVLVMRK